MDYKVSMFLKGMKNKQFFLAILIILTSMIFSVSAFIEEGMEYFFNHNYLPLLSIKSSNLTLHSSQIDNNTPNGNCLSPLS